MTTYLWSLVVALDQFANALLAPAHRACMNEYNRGSRIKNKTVVTHAE